MSSEERLIELESRIAHQDHTIHTLSEELIQQQKKLEQLETTCNFLAEQLRARIGESGSVGPDDEKPPHY